MSEESFTTSFKRFLLALALTTVEIALVPVDIILRFISAINEWSKEKVESYSIRKQMQKQDISYDDVRKAVDHETKVKVKDNGN